MCVAYMNIYQWTFIHSCYRLRSSMTDKLKWRYTYNWYWAIGEKCGSFDFRVTEVLDYARG